jgi:hypothetical protein
MGDQATMLWRNKDMGKGDYVGHEDTLKHTKTHEVFRQQLISRAL